LRIGRDRQCIQGGPKSEPLPSYQKIMLNCVKFC